MSWYVYMVRCRDNSLYTGYTNDPKRRLCVHNSGQGAKYTRSRLPVSLAYVERCPDKLTAQRREYTLKQLHKAQKEALCQSGWSREAAL